MALEFTLNHAAPATATTDCIVVGVFSGSTPADNSLTPAAQAIDTASGGKLAALIERGDVSGKTGKTALLHDLPGVTAPRVLVIGLGDKDKFGTAQYIKAVGDAARGLKTGPVASALFTISEVPVKERDSAWNIRNAAIAAGHACYRYTATLGAKNKKRDETGLKAFSISGTDEHALAQGKAIAAGVAFARELGNLPPNICNPAYLARAGAGIRRALRQGRVRSARPRADGRARHGLAARRGARLGQSAEARGAEVEQRR